jgi:hypothetical protein
MLNSLIPDIPVTTAQVPRTAIRYSRADRPGVGTAIKRSPETALVRSTFDSCVRRRLSVAAAKANKRHAGDDSSPRRQTNLASPKEIGVSSVEDTQIEAERR